MELPVCRSRWTRTCRVMGCSRGEANEEDERESGWETALGGGGSSQHDISAESCMHGPHMKMKALAQRAGVGYTLSQLEKGGHMAREE